MKRLRKVTILLISTLLLLSIFNFVKADSSDLYLNNLDFDVQINFDGSMDVIETWNIDIEDTNTLFKTFERDSSKYTRITDGKVSKISLDGKEIDFIDSKKYYYHVPTNQYYFLNRGNEYEVAWGTGYENSSGTATYKISYHVENAVAIYNDCSELYWQFIGSDFEIPAKKITGKIKLPSEVESKEDIRVWGHTPDLNGTIYFTNNNTVEFEINNNKARKMVEVRIAMPKEVVMSGRMYTTDRLDRIIEEETGWANEANSRRINKIVIVVIISLIIFAILIYFFIRNILVLKNTKPVNPSIHHDYFRDLPRQDATPAEATYILENKYIGFDSYDIGRVFSSTLLNLSLKKAIKIERFINQKGKEENKIEINCENIRNLTNKMDEILIFDFVKTASQNKKNGIFGNKNTDIDNQSITMQELKKYIQSNNSKVISLKSNLDSYMKTNLISNNILDEEGIKKRKKLSLNTIINTFITFLIFFFLADPEIIVLAINSIGIPWGVIIIMIVFAIIDIVLGNVAKNKISVYTQKGVDEQDKWKALKKYMEDFSLLNERDIPDLVLWEKFLVYATAFGISEKVIKQLKIVYPDYNNLDYGLYPNMYIFMNMDFARSFNSVSNSMSSAFSSGSGGGGGFSGGGGRRRWSVAVEEEDKTSTLRKNIKVILYNKGGENGKNKG